MNMMPRTGDTPRIGFALAGLSLSMVLASLGSSVANVALPTLMEAFGAPFQAVQWVVLAYLLASTTLIVSVGRLGDLLDRRRLLLAGLVLFAVASLLCGVAQSLPLLIAARALQGSSAAVLMALSLALASEIVPRNRTGRAVGLLGTASAVGTALGPSLGGFLIAGFSWRAIFMCNVPLALAALLLTARWLPGAARATGATRPKFDLPGTLLLALTLGAYALAMTIGRGQFGALNVGLLAAAIAGLALFLGIEARAASPVMPLHLLHDPVLRGGLALSALVSTVMMTTLVVGPFYLSQALGLAPAAVGMVMSVGPLVVAGSGLPAGRLVDHLGTTRLVMPGLAAMMGGTVLLAVIPVSAGIPGYLAGIVVTTLGYALFQTANTTAVMQDVPPDQRGAISGTLNLSRNLGLITGASLLGAIFALAAGASDLAAAPPEAVAQGMRTTFLVAAALLLAALGIAAISRGPGLRAAALTLSRHPR
ncbi:MAG: MFS transporter [Chloroflexota bacterium]|nr:MFS transporter [Chloroflexota bacterium]